MVSSNTPAVVESFDLANADDGAKLATILADYIVNNNLSTKIQGKDFVGVEGWMYAGARLGIVARVVSTADISTDSVIRFECRVELFDLRRQLIIGSGEAECDNTESGKKFYARYAIKSMAQTRAIGKAYRNLLAWIIKAAGYNATPAEEMTTLADACLEALTAADITVLKEVVTNYRQDFGNNQTFRLAAEARKGVLKPAASATAPKLATEAQQAHLLKLLKSHHNDGLRDYATGRICDTQPMDECSELIEAAMGNINRKSSDRPSLSDYPEMTDEADAESY